MGWLDKIIDKIPLGKITQKIDKGAAVVQGNNIKSGLRQLLKANEDFEEQAKLHGAAHHDYVVQINKKVQRLLKDMEGRMLKEEIKNKFFDPILQSEKYSKATKNCLKGVLDQHIEDPSIKNDRAFVEDYIPNFKEKDSEYYDQVVNKYSALMLEKEKFKVFNSEDLLPYPKEIIKKALFFSMKRLEDWKKNPKIVEFMSEKKILKLAKAIGTGYVHLFFYQDDDFLKELKTKKGRDKLAPEIAKLSKKHTRDFKKHTGKDIRDMEMAMAIMACMASLGEMDKK